MKKLFILIFAAGLFSCNSEKKKTETVAVKNTDLIQQNLQGKIQGVTEATYAMDSLGNIKSDSTFAISSYDEKGYQVKSITKDSSGKITMEQTMSHNADGSFAELVTMKNGKQFNKLITEVKDGKYNGGKAYDSTSEQTGYYTDLKQNEYGIVYEGRKHDMNGKVVNTFTMKYDGPHFTGGTSTDSTGKTDYTGSVKLNEKGDPIEESTTTLQKGVSKTEVTTYKYESADEKGNWLQRTTYNDKGKATKILKRTISYYKD